MKSALPSARSIVITFVIAVVFYAVSYQWLTRRQTARGPWEVTFTRSEAGPEVIIAQPHLGISNVVVQFPGETISSTNPTRTVAFVKPQQPVPFGEVIYDDLMFLPGDVALDCFGHLVEMVPRFLALNGHPLPWTNGTVHVLHPTNRLSAEARRELKGGYRK